jgi:TetR/AcrR family transcriptional repressor of nem operon
MMQHGISKRTALVQAAKALLWEGGYAAMSPRDVLQRSGAGQGSLYHHFSGKQALAVEALDEIATEEMAAVDAVFDSDAPPLARIRAYLEREREALRGCRLARLANESAIEDAALRRPIAVFLDHIALQLRACLEQAQAAGELPATLRPAEVAAALLAIVEGGFVLARVHWDAQHMRQALHGGVQLLDAIARHGAA